jgi:uncharacterized RDD family membrane protein YckC
MSEPFIQPPPTHSTPRGPTGPRAGFWVRVGALIIDLLIVGGVGIVLVIIGAAAGSSALEVIGWLIFVLGSIAYDIYFHGKPAGQTVGKRALGIRVIDFSTGGPIGYGRAALRYVGRFISGTFCYLGYLWMLWDKEKQTWHDKMANDVVVPTSAYPVEHWP